jgi:hypothetical protein
MAAPWSHGSRQAVAIGTVVPPCHRARHDTLQALQSRASAYASARRHGGLPCPAVPCLGVPVPCRTGRHVWPPIGMSCCMLVPTLINNGVRVSVRKRAVDQPRPEARPHPVYTPTSEHWPCLDSLAGLELELVSNSNSIPKLTLALEVFG